MIRLARLAVTLTVVLGLPLLSGCAPGPAITRDGPAVAAPTYRVGDRWVYKAQDGFLSPVIWDEVREVAAVGANGITIRVTQRGPGVDNQRTEELTAPGLVRRGAVFDAETRDFATPLVRYRFPLTPGESWRGFVTNFNQSTRKAGQFSHWVSVQGWGQVTTPAGTFDALRLHISMQLDDEEFWRWPTQCSYYVWYAPAVRGIVLEEKQSFYYEKTDSRSQAMIRSQNGSMQLISFTPGTGANWEPVGLRPSQRAGWESEERLTRF